MQRRKLAAGLTLLLLLGCSMATNPASLSYEGKWRRILEVSKEINAELENVTDQASSEQAAPRLRALVAEYNSLDAAIESSSAQSMEQMNRIQSEYMQPLMAELMTTATHAMRCQFDSNLAATSDAISGMDSNN